MELHTFPAHLSLPCCLSLMSKDMVGWYYKEDVKCFGLQREDQIQNQNVNV